MQSRSTPEDRPDRYASFRGINFEQNIEKVLAHLRRYTDDPEYNNPFWKRFWERLGAIEANDVPIADKLLLLHSHTYYLCELFEDNDDEAAVADLARLERECF